MKKITGSNYKKDKLYPAVARAIAEIMKTEDAVTPIDVLMRMNRIDKKAYEVGVSAAFPIWRRSFLGAWARRVGFYASWGCMPNHYSLSHRRRCIGNGAKAKNGSFCGFQNRGIRTSKRRIRRTI